MSGDVSDVQELLVQAATSRATELSLFETDPELIASAAPTVWALLFNVGSDSEGIYSRHLAGQELVVVFEEHDDAYRYGDMLVATDFPEATPTEVETGSLITFCENAGHTMGLVKRGTLVSPPEDSVDEFSWSPGTSAEGEVGPQEMSVDELEASRRKLESLLSQS